MDEYGDRIITMVSLKRRRYFMHCFLIAVLTCLVFTLSKYLTERLAITTATTTGEKSLEISSPPVPEVLPEYEYFIEAIDTRADRDRYIVLAMADEAFVDMAINFYEASLQAHHVNNFLFVGVGRRTCRTLRNLSIPCFYYADDPNAGEASDYGQRNFIRKMNIRTEMIIEALTANFSVIHTDMDVAFLSNPVSEIKVTCLVLCLLFTRVYVWRILC